MAERGDVIRPIAIVVGLYLILTAGGIRWHWAAGPPFYHGTPGLLITLAIVAALVGLISIWASFAVVHWSTRASGMIAGAAVLAGVATFFFEWNDFLIWQLVVLIFAQFGCMVAVLSACRLSGYAIRRDGNGAEQPAKVASARALRFKVSNLLLITTAMGLLFSVLHYARPVRMEVWFYAILLIGGLCTAIVALAPLWAGLSKQRTVFRIAALIAAAPMGGLVYAVLDYYEPLLFSWQWYAAVTTFQVLFMTLPLAFLRSKGYRFGRVAA